MTGPVPCSRDWATARLSEARAILADVAHHRDGLVRIACEVLITHGETPQEREDARLLLVVVDARTPQRHGHHQRSDRDRDPEGRR
jgi:hypothetical protein